MRCLTLADELRRRGAAVRFGCRDLPGNAVARIEAAGFPVSLIAPDADEARDAQACLALLAERGADWLVVDHYALGVAWERALRVGARRILAIDDLARPHDCDAVLDQNWHGEATQSRYAGLVSEQCERWLGPRFAMLKPEYAALRASRRPRDGDRRLFVFFGASDLSDETSKVLEALSLPRFARWSVDVVIGANHPNRDHVVALARARLNTSVHGDLPTLAPLLAQASVAIGAGGTTTWERLCLGVPSLVTTLAANQEAVTASLAAAGFVRWIGSSAETTSSSYARALDEPLDALLERDPLVDGLGTKRVAEGIMPSSAAVLRLRLAVDEDSAQLFAWRNDPHARAMSFDTRPVDWPTHSSWFARRLADRDCLIFVLDVDGLPLGQIRFDLEPEEAALSYSLDRLVRGRGWSAWLVAAALRELARLRPMRVRALVKDGNVASRKVFTKLGWTESAGDGFAVFRSPRTASSPT